jgi:hypothetical protein
MINGSLIMTMPFVTNKVLRIDLLDLQIPLVLPLASQATDNKAITRYIDLPFAAAMANMLV